MKKILAAVLTVFMSFALVTPAFAAGLSSAEQSLLAEFKDELNYWAKEAQLDQEHINQYYGQAETALTAVDLSDAACKEFSSNIKEIHNILAGSKTRHDLWSHYSEIAKILNTTGAKYYKLHVTVNSSDKNAKVTWEIDGKTSTAATVGSSTSTVKQTGFGLAQTAAVAGISLAVLAGAFVVARKKQLFVA